MRIPELKPGNILDKLSTLLFYLCLFVFIVALAFPHNPAGNWYQQFMPNIGGRQITDITFTDSLTGYAVTSLPSLTDTAFILKTTNGGDNWVINHRDSAMTFRRIQFINQSTGFAGGRNFMRTTNAGNNWEILSQSLFFDDMYVLNKDTAWFAKSESLTGGVFFTSTGGVSWQQQINLGNQNPNHIYMYNGRIGFICEDNNYLRKTTNSGINWNTISGADGFLDMYFIDSLTGWKASGFMKKTTNGGLNWVNQILPSGGNIIVTSIEKFSNVNNDTIFGVSGYANTGLGARGMIYRTTNGGDNWFFQIPDSNINIFRYLHNKFVNKRNGWAYNPITGVHTTTGGDPVWLLPLTQISSEVPKEYILEQNYPNPFNPKTIIRFQISKLSDLKIAVYDITGKEITTLVNERLKAGVYETEFDGSNYSSGVYFYSLIIEGKVIETKRMMLIK